MTSALVVNVAQILEGEARCYCGAPASLVVTTDPDNEPGPACSRHGLEWVDLACSRWRGADALLERSAFG